MATASLLLVVDYKSRALLSAMGSRLPASTPHFVQGDNVAVELHLVAPSASFANATPETPIPASAAVYIAVGTPGATPVAQASLSTALTDNLGRTGVLSLNTAEVASFLGSSDSKDATFEAEMTEADGTATTLLRIPCKVLNDLIAAGGAAPAAVPSIVADIATLRDDIDSLRGGVPLTGWANSTAYPFGTCTITGGIPSALEFAGVTDDFAYAELALSDFAPDTLDISGAVSAGTVELTDLSLVFLDGAGAEAGAIGALTLGAAFSFASVVVPSGAAKVAIKALGTAATSSLSTGFTALYVTANANLSELTADALAVILANKATAQADAGTIAALVTPAQADAQTIADLVTPAQADAQTIADLVTPAQVDAAAVAGYAATAAAAVADMTVAPLDSIATTAQVVRGSDLRLGLRGGVACTVGGSTTATALAPVAPFSLVTLGIEVSPLAAASAVRVLWSTGTGNTTSDLRLKIATDGKLLFDEGNGTGFTSSTAYAAAGARWVWCKYDAAANTVSVYADSSDTPAFTYSRRNATTLNAITYLGGTGAATAYTGTIRSVCALNFSATVAERIAAMRGEYPQAWLGGATTSAAFAGAWTDGNFTSGGGTITVNAGGTLSASCSATTADNAINATLAAAPQPLLRHGRVVRLRYSLTVNSGSAPTIKIQQGTVLSGLVALPAGAASLTDVAVTLDGLAADTNIKLRIQTVGASNFTLSNVSVEILGAQILVGPQDWARTRGVDMSGNCNDLIYGTGVVAIEPATKARVVQATAAGATVSAGAVASVGTLSGATYRDTKALAAMRQWDAVSANWRQARPANCAALQAAVATAGTPTAEATAITGNVVIAANAALNLTHHIN